MLIESLVQVYQMLLELLVNLMEDFIIFQVVAVVVVEIREAVQEQVV